MISHLAQAWPLSEESLWKSGIDRLIRLLFRPGPVWPIGLTVFGPHGPAARQAATQTALRLY